MSVHCKINCRLGYSLSEPSVFVFNIAPSSTELQRVEQEEFVVKPELPIEEFTGPDGRSRYHRVEVQSGEFAVDYRARIDTQQAIEPSGTSVPVTPPGLLPPHTLPFLVPSRYCESDRLMRLSWSEFGDLPETIERPQRIAEWIHKNVQYLVGRSGPMTSAFNTATGRAGVCRDFAHLGIAMCRAMNIPARFVSAYAVGLQPPDFHAVFEAWLDGRWYLFDPTRMVVPSRIVRVGTGRDAAEVSFALIFGPAEMTTMDVQAELAA